jgi:acyl-CoA thioesterase
MMMDNVARQDQFAKHLKAEIIEVTPGYAKVKMAVQEYFLNGVKTVHGGVLFSLADFAFALASNTSGETGVAINVNIQFMKAAFLGDELVAEARLMSRSKRLGSFIGEVVNQDQKKIAQFQAMAFFKDPQK